jgi:hypothetical protein
MSVDAPILEDACYYLRKLGASLEEIATQFGLTPGQVGELADRWSGKLARGEVKEDPVDLDFWRNVHREASGDQKLTLVDRDGHFYHGWRSQLEHADTATLLMLYEACREFVARHPELNFPAPVGYDPLAPARQVKAVVPVLQALLERRTGEEGR